MSFVSDLFDGGRKGYQSVLPAGTYVGQWEPTDYTTISERTNDTNYDSLRDATSAAQAIDGAQAIVQHHGGFALYDLVSSRDHPTEQDAARAVGFGHAAEAKGRGIWIAFEDGNRRDLLHDRLGDDDGWGPEWPSLFDQIADRGY